MNRKQIEACILYERYRQNILHPEPLTVRDGKAISVLLEEVGEVAKALQEEDQDNLIEELVQVAAVCVRWLEEIKEGGNS